jgi:NAD(P)-dependent dehydrogenase (short-subunit alcohol dehydrogenase family)
MRRAGGGSIVNIASLSANVAGPYAAAYHASKGAVRIFTKAAAIQYAKENIRVNSVHPGPVDTRMIRDAYAESWLKRIDTQSPMGRMGTVDEVAYCVLFLASDEASYITGAELIVDGGWGAQ